MRVGLAALAGIMLAASSFHAIAEQDRIERMTTSKMENFEFDNDYLRRRMMGFQGSVGRAGQVVKRIMGMMVRVAMGSAPVWQLLLSMALLIGTFIFTTWLAGRIYRTGILMYGKKVSWKEMGKWLFYKG